MHVLILLLSVLPVWAGRPVFHDFSLSDLVARSHIVAVVTKAPEGAPDNKCEKKHWQLTVKELLGVQSQLRHSEGVSTYPAKEDTYDEKELRELASPGKVLQVVWNKTWFIDCSYRKINGSGASFAAERYIPSDSKIPSKAAPFIVFIQRQGDELYLTTHGAYESLSQKGKVKKVARK